MSTKHTRKIAQNAKREVVKAADKAAGQALSAKINAALRNVETSAENYAGGRAALIDAWRACIKLNVPADHISGAARVGFLVRYLMDNAPAKPDHAQALKDAREIVRFASSKSNGEGYKNLAPLQTRAYDAAKSAVSYMKGQAENRAKSRRKPRASGGNAPKAGKAGASTAPKTNDKPLPIMTTPLAIPKVSDVAQADAFAFMLSKLAGEFLSRNAKLQMGAAFTFLQTVYKEGQPFEHKA